LHSPDDGDDVPRILCAGIAVLDQIFRVESFPTPDSKARAAEFIRIGGGCAANAAVTVVRLGGRAEFVGPLGGPPETDAIGNNILAGLQRENVDCDRCLRVPGAPSPVSMILVDRRGERMIVTHRDERLLAARPGDAGLLQGADAVLADNRFPNYVQPICEAARERNIPVVLDADKPAPDSDLLFRLATHVIFSAEALRGTIGESDLGVALAQMAALTKSFLAVTDGPQDMLWWAGTRVCRMPAFRIEVADTLAAGDVLHGAFALALAEGAGPVDALRFGAAAAAIKCTRFGGIGGAPHRAEVDALAAARSLLK
jgi:sugar/nucleoside kinase (ribokinase family)